MKLITAIIQPDVLDRVRESLVEVNVTRITVARISGHGRQQDQVGQNDTDIYRGQVFMPSLIPKVRLDIAVHDAMVETTIAAIVRSARHGDGEVGDGKIFITNLEDCVRIRTGTRGKGAI